MRRLRPFSQSCQRLGDGGPCGQRTILLIIEVDAHLAVLVRSLGLVGLDAARAQSPDDDRAQIALACRNLDEVTERGGIVLGRKSLDASGESAGCVELGD